LLTVVQTDGRGSALERKVVEIDRKLSDLHNLIQRVSERIGSPAPSLAGDNNT
jgi:hypothetical protein